MWDNQVNSRKRLINSGVIADQSSSHSFKVYATGPQLYYPTQKQGAGSERPGRRTEWGSDTGTNQNIHVDVGIEGGGVDGVEGRCGRGGRGRPRQGRGGRGPGGSGWVGVVEASKEVARAPRLLVHCQRCGATGCRHIGEASRRGSQPGRRRDQREVVGVEMENDKGCFGRFRFQA